MSMSSLVAAAADALYTSEEKTIKRADLPTLQAAPGQQELQDAFPYAFVFEPFGGNDPEAYKTFMATDKESGAALYFDDFGTGAYNHLTLEQGIHPLIILKSLFADCAGYRGVFRVID